MHGVFSRMCQEANAIVIVLSRSFLGGLELNLHRHKLSRKRLNYALSYDIIWNYLKLSENAFLAGVYKNQSCYEPFTLESGSVLNSDNFDATNLRF